MAPPSIRARPSPVIPSFRGKPEQPDQQCHADTGGQDDEKPSLPTTCIAKKTKGCTIIMGQRHIEPGKHFVRAIQLQQIACHLLGMPVEHDHNRRYRKPRPGVWREHRGFYIVRRHDESRLHRRRFQHNGHKARGGQGQSPHRPGNASNEHIFRVQKG